MPKLVIPTSEMEIILHEKWHENQGIPLDECYALVPKADHTKYYRCGTYADCVLTMQYYATNDRKIKGA